MKTPGLRPQLRDEKIGSGEHAFVPRRQCLCARRAPGWGRSGERSGLSHVGSDFFRRGNLLGRLPQIPAPAQVALGQQAPGGLLRPPRPHRARSAAALAPPEPGAASACGLETG